MSGDFLFFRQVFVLFEKGVFPSGIQRMEQLRYAQFDITKIEVNAVGQNRWQFRGTQLTRAAGWKSSPVQGHV